MHDDPSVLLRGFFVWERRELEEDVIVYPIFTYKIPANLAERHRNKEALHILDIKRSQLLLDVQALGTGLLPSYRLKTNFLDYYEEFVNSNRKSGNRHLEGSLQHFKTFLSKKYLPPVEVTEELCVQFRKYLLDRCNGDTPSNYFSRFKKVIKAATRQGYFRISPVEDLVAKANRNKTRKDHLESAEYIRLLETPCLNGEVKAAFIFCCYTGLRWCDIKSLQWKHIIMDGKAVLKAQQKTGGENFVTLHPIAQSIIQLRKSNSSIESQIFQLPTAEGANRALSEWCNQAGFSKHITWNCARLSFSILLQDANVNPATVALLLGHTTSKYVNDIYRRHIPKDQSQVINRLPDPEIPSYFLGFTLLPTPWYFSFPLISGRFSS